MGDFLFKDGHLPAVPAVAIPSLGAYTASRPETGLLIPPDYNS